jgi:hypothetical protein
MDLRRILKCEYISGDEVTVHACTTRKKGMEGSKLKKMKFQFENGAATAKAWYEAMVCLVYGSVAASLEPNISRGVIILVDKFDAKGPTKLVTEHMKPVFDVMNKPCEIKSKWTALKSTKQISK